MSLYKVSFSRTWLLYVRMTRFKSFLEVEKLNLGFFRKTGDQDLYVSYMTKGHEASAVLAQLLFDRIKPFHSMLQYIFRYLNISATESHRSMTSRVTS